ncbi:MAG: cytochrome c, partial [Acidobacteriia bacterium]|nr:cytochrome c [Terriglobia bacterium]
MTLRTLLLLTAATIPATAQTVTWAEHIAPIIYNNCTKCHRAGQVAPFTLASYSDVKQRARTIASVTQS